MTVGTHGDYEWLITELTFDDLLELCPEFVVGKYVAVATYDSGPLHMNDVQSPSGWESRLGVMYSPKISTVEGLPYDKCCCFNEWYLFDAPADIGQRAEQGSNIFQPSSVGERIYDFVSFCLDLRRTDMHELDDLFWKQLDRIRPQSYVGDTQDFLTIVSADKHLFAAVRLALSAAES
jgi:hypothetical protein